MQKVCFIRQNELVLWNLKKKISKIKIIRPGKKVERNCLTYIGGYEMNDFYSVWKCRDFVFAQNLYKHLSWYGKKSMQAVGFFEHTIDFVWDRDFYEIFK